MKADGYLDAAKIQQRWEQHRTGRVDHTSALWPVLMFQAWLDAEQQGSTNAASDPRLVA
jgi:asparagine synthase (glutamine-hydrolysing)